MHDGPMIGIHKSDPHINAEPVAHFSVDADGDVKQNYSTAQRALCPDSNDVCLYKCVNGRCWTYESVDKDAINPSHYKSHPSGVECITVVEHMGFNLGNAMKYIWRADLKNNAIEDLRKAAWYLEREIKRRESS